MHPPFYQRRILLSTLITTIISGTAVAEEARLPTISVTASPLNDSQTLNSSIIDAEELMSLAPATSDTASLLRNVPGLNIQGSGGVSGLPVIHGLADDRLRIKVDGMDLISACGNHMNPALSYIDPTNVGSAAVFAGITPVSIGGDSIGGTILVDSAEPQFAKDGDSLLQTGEIGAFYRSNNKARGGNLGATLASDKLSINYQASTTRADNYHAGEDFKPAGLAAAGRGWLEGDEVGSSMYKSINQSLTMAMRQDNHLVELKLGVQDIPYQGWTNQRMDMTGNDSDQINLRYEGQYDWGELEARAYNEQTRHAMQFYDDKLYWYGGGTIADGDSSCIPSGGMTGCAAGMPMDTQGDNTGVVIKAEIPLSARDLLRAGIETQEYRLDDWWDPSGKGMWPNTFWNINDGERDRLARLDREDLHAEGASLFPLQKCGIPGPHRVVDNPLEDAPGPFLLQHLSFLDASVHIKGEAGDAGARREQELVCCLHSSAASIGERLLHICEGDPLTDGDVCRMIDEIEGCLVLLFRAGHTRRQGSDTAQQIGWGNGAVRLGSQRLDPAYEPVRRSC